MTGTTYYNLNLPAHGDTNWDTPVNANFTSIDSILHGKQDSLTAGGNIDITSNTVNLKKDGTSITNNSSGQIQAAGVINSRDSSTTVKTWTGTRAQYNAIVSKDANTLYNITDDTTISLSILEALYPVGSIYITTASTCPLSTLISGSTWTLVSSGRVLQGADSGHSAGTTIEAGLPSFSYNYPTNHTGYPNGSADTGNGTTTYQAYWRGWNTGNYSDSVYGQSSTVQPPAYIVNIFRRTA